MIPINRFCIFQSMIKTQFLFFIKQYAWNFLEFGCMHTNKNIKFLEFGLKHTKKKYFCIFEIMNFFNFLIFLNFEEKQVFLIPSSYLIV